MAQEIRKFAYIDAVRAIAILMVIALHASQHVEGSPLVARAALFGQLGVQLFFVASALTLCLSAEARKGEPIALRNFYLRRVLRIAPAYYVGICFYYVWTLFAAKHGVGPFSSADPYTVKNVLANVFFLHGFYPAANNTIVPGGWSIGTEMAFYAIFPLLFYVMSRLKNRAVVAMLFPGATLIVVPYVETLYGIVFQNNNFLYFSILTQINTFIVGMYYYFETKDGAMFWTRPILAFTAFGAVTLMLSIQGYFFWVPFFSAIAFVALIEMVRNAPHRLLSALAPIGKVSFSMYLFHFAVISALGQLVNRGISLKRWIGPDLNLLFFFGVSALTTWVIANMSYRYIEAPMVKLGGRLIGSRRPARSTFRQSSG